MLIATFPGAATLQVGQGAISASLERAVFSCDYNGWQDIPEEEREGLETFEATRVAPERAVAVSLVVRRPVLPIPSVPDRRAA